jgi:transposase, IS5 family
MPARTAVEHSSGQRGRRRRVPTVLCDTCGALSPYGRGDPTSRPTLLGMRKAKTLLRVEQVGTQTTRRVLQGAQGPASEKIVSLFAPATAILRNGKPGKPTAFGRVLWLEEVEGGSISRYAVLDGNPDEKAQGPLSLAPHRQQFGPPPMLLTGDWGRHSTANER